MKVTNGLMCHAMVGAITGQTKIKRKLKKIRKREEEKDLAHEVGPNRREFISQIGENWELITKAK